MSNVIDITPARTEWLARCAKRLQQLGPLFTDEHAHDLAAELHFAWPEMVPEQAANVFLAPEQIAA